MQSDCPGVIRQAQTDIEYVTYICLCYYIAHEEINKYSLRGRMRLWSRVSRRTEASAVCALKQLELTAPRRQADDGNEHYPSLIPHHHRPAAST